MIHDVPVWLQAFIALCGTVGTFSAILNNYWTYRVKMETLHLHDCLDSLHEKVTVAVATDDARDIRNEGPRAIVSGVNPNEPG